MWSDHPWHLWGTLQRPAQLYRCWWMVCHQPNLLYNRRAFTQKLKAAAERQVYRRTRGRKRKQLHSDVYKPSVRRMETDSVEALKSEVEICHNEIEEWRKRWVDLEREKQIKSSMKWRRNTQARGRNYWLDLGVNWDLADYGRSSRKEGVIGRVNSCMN